MLVEFYGIYSKETQTKETVIYVLKKWRVWFSIVFAYGLYSCSQA